MDYQTYLQHKPIVQGFFDSNTNTISYVVADPKTKKCTIIDSVMNFDQPSGTISFTSAKAIIDYITKHSYTVDWIMETHVHADHLSAAPYLKEKLGGLLAIGEHIITVQKLFGKTFNAGTEFARDGGQFDKLWKDGDKFTVGNIRFCTTHSG